MSEHGWTVRLNRFRTDDEEEDETKREWTKVKEEDVSNLVTELMKRVTDKDRYIMVLRDE
jgi:hypothetical protein